MTKLGGIQRRDRTEPEVRLIPLDDLIIENRVRQNMGDIEGLAASIQERTLLQPIVVTPDNTVLAGERRVLAVESLGWTEIPAMVVTGYEELADCLAAERDENLCRKDWEPEEMLVMADRLTAALAPAAAARKAATQAKPGEKVGSRRLTRSSSPEDKSPDRNDDGQRPTTLRTERTEDTVAQALGTSPRRLRRTRAVVEATSDPDPEVQTVATEARSEMACTGQVDPAWRKVKTAKGTQAPAKRRPAKRQSSPPAASGAGPQEVKGWASRLMNWLDANKPQADAEVPPDFLGALEDLGQSIDEWTERA